jgi:ABC-type thiamine transport system ATPase subunit
MSLYFPERQGLLAARVAPSQAGVRVEPPVLLPSSVTCLLRDLANLILSLVKQDQREVLAVMVSLSLSQLQVVYAKVALVVEVKVVFRGALSQP